MSTNKEVVEVVSVLEEEKGKEGSNLPIPINEAEKGDKIPAGVIQKTIPFIFEYPKVIDAEAKCFQANELTQAIHRMSEMEQKIYKILINHIKPNDDVFQIITIKIRDLLRLLEGEDSQNYTRVLEVLTKLQTRVMRIYERNSQTKYAEGKHNSMLQVNLIGPIRHFEGLGIVEVYFHPQMMPYLLNLKNSKNYTILNLNEFVNISGSYSLRFYELCSEFKDTGWFVKSVDELKDMLEVKDKYELYGDFRRFVLESAKEELKKRSKLSFDYTVQSKKGRKVEKLLFVVNNDKEEKSDEEKKMEEKLKKEFNLAEYFAKRVVAKLSKQEIFKTCYEITLAKKSRTGVTNLGAYSATTFTKKYPELEKNIAAKDAKVIGITSENVELMAQIAGLPVYEYLFKVGLMIDDKGMEVKRE